MDFVGTYEFVSDDGKFDDFLKCMGKYSVLDLCLIGPNATILARDSVVLCHDAISTSQHLQLNIPRNISRKAQWHKLSQKLWPIL